MENFDQDTWPANVVNHKRHRLHLIRIEKESGLLSFIFHECLTANLAENAPKQGG
jgi:hypothetical protein